MSPDPYSASGGSGSPASWNRYSYTRGDPVNRSDRTGLEDREVDDGDCDPDNDDCTPTFTVTHTEDGGGGGDPEPDPPAPDPEPPPDPTPAPDPPAPPAPAPVKRKRHKPKFNPCANKADVAFLKNNLADAAKLAAALNVPVQFVLAVAADESQYGGYPTAIAANNFFGIHAGSIAVNAGSTGPYAGNPIFAAWAPGTDGFLGSGNAMVTMALSDGAKGVMNALQFFTDINKQFGVGNSKYASNMVDILSSVTARLNCP